MKKTLIILIFLSIFSLCFSEVQSIRLINGSNIYVKIFLFFFPIGKQYDSYSVNNDDGLSINIDINQDKINNEPINEQEKESLFNTDISFNIREIEYGMTGNFILPLTIRCNRKIIRKNVNFTVVFKQNIMVLKGHTDILVGELNENEMYKKRSNWKYPFHFDLRFQLP